MYGDDGSIGPGADRHPSALPNLAGEVFFAFKPDLSDAAETDRVSRKLRGACGLTGKPLTPDRLHLTVCYLGDLPELQQASLDRVKHIAAGMSARPFDITFDRVKSAPYPRSRKPFVLVASQTNAGLLLFQRELVKTLKNAGLLPGKLPPFKPHVTLVWDVAEIREMPLDVTMTWTVREFQLVCSVTGQGRHECLGRWPLKG
jgi:2'-5' RNA ligase